MTGCTRANKSKLLYALVCIIIAYDRLWLGIIKSGKTPFSRLAAALALHCHCI